MTAAPAAPAAPAALALPARGATPGPREARATKAPFRFAAPVKHATGKDTVTKLADVTGDGLLDMVTCGRDGVGVLAGEAGGAFGVRTTFLKGKETEDVVAHDVSGDGIVDLVAISDGAVSALLGSGGGSFSDSVTSPASPGAYGLDVGDLNGDGKPDLAESFRNDSAYGLSLQLGAGDGTFAPPTPVETGYGVRGVQLADLDGDGRLDIVTGVNEFEERYGVGVLLGDGAGGFGAMTTFSVGRDLEPSDIAVGDMNGDGIPDLVLDMTLEGDTDLGILLGDGSGGFHQAKASSVWELHPASYENELYSIALGDFDGDGSLDVAAARRGKLMVVRCDGAGGFLKRQRVVMKDLKYPVVLAGDLDGSGHPDLVSGYSGTADVRLNLAR